MSNSKDPKNKASKPNTKSGRAVKSAKTKKSSTGKPSKRLLRLKKAIKAGLKSYSKRLLKFKKRTSRRYKRFSKKITLRLKKRRQRLSKALPKINTRKVLGSRYLRAATVILAIIIGVLAGTLFGYKALADGNSLLSKNSIRQVREAPSALSAVGPPQSNQSFTMYPTWAQNFANDPTSKLSSSYWNIYKGIPENSNNEAEYYTGSPSNINIKNGALNLTATKQAEPDGYSYGSSRIDTEGKISFLYGRINVTAKLPDSVGSWPAIWFLPANNKYEDMSPPSDSLRYLNGGEMDLAEEVGYQANVEYGVVHTLSDLGNPSQEGAFNTVTVPNNQNEYNVYSLLWTPTAITFEVNNVPFFTYNKPPGSNYTTWAFDQPFYMIADLALGGVWGGQDTSVFPGNGIDNSALPVTMSIQSIYYYPLKAN